MSVPYLDPFRSHCFTDITILVFQLVHNLQFPTDSFIKVLILLN